MHLFERLDNLPYGPFHRRLLMMGGLGYLFDALDVGIIAFLLPSLKLQWSLSLAQMGLLAASSSIGGIAGAFGAGLIGDRIGRRRVMMWSLAIYCIATVGCALSNSWVQFLVFRIIAGIGTSAESAIIAPFLAEFAGSSFRGRYLGTLTAFFSGGFLLAALLGYSIVPLSDDAWRLALLLAALPIVMLLWWRRSLPESPRWLVSRGRLEEALSIVKRVETSNRGFPVKSTASDFDIRHQIGTETVDEPAKVRASVLVSILLIWFSMGFSYYAFFTWTPTLLVEEGMPITRSFGFAIAIYAAQLPGYLLAAALSDRLGRQAIIAIFLVASTCASAGIALGQTEVAIVAAAIAMSFFMNGTYAGLYAYTAELFPTRRRATVQGAAGAISRFGAALSPLVVAILYPHLGFAGVFTVTGGFLLAAAALTILFGINTRNRSLELVAHEHRDAKKGRP